MNLPVSLPMLLGAICLLNSGAASQRGPSTQQLFASLHSPDPGTRAGALQTLHATRGAFSRPGVSAVLLETLERENQLIARTYLESHGTEGVVDTYGEEYGEYFGQLADDCLKHCDLSDPRALLALGETYPAESPALERLATDHGPMLLPGFLEATKSPDDEVRRMAVGKVGVVDALSRTLSTRERERADSILSAGKVNYPVRAEAEKAMAVIRRQK